MVTREYIKCNICEHNYIVRIGVGLERNCIHTFDCIECSMPISVNVLSMPPNASVQAEENCTILQFEPEQGTVYNLHPNFAINIEKIHQEKYFASMELIPLLFPIMKRNEGKHQDVELQFFLPNCSNLWLQIKKLLELEGRRRFKKNKTQDH